MSRCRLIRPGGCLVALLLGWTMLSYSASAHTYIDPLSDWSNTIGHSADMRIDTHLLESLGITRATRTETTDGYLVYKVDAQSFSAQVYYDGHYQAIFFFSSPDGTNWTKAASTITGPAPMEANNPLNHMGLPTWATDTMAGTFPPGTHYVMVQIKANPPTELNQPYAPEIGPIEFSTDTIDNIGNDLTPSPNGPQGLTVMAASSQAYISWYPLKGANSYTIKRSTNYSADYSSIASKLTTTNYVDNGLSTSTRYNYAILANMSDGTTLCSQIVPRTPDAGSVVFDDPLTDWSNVNDHTNGLGFVKQNGNVAAVRRTTSETESLTYNLPGSVKFEANVYFHGDVAGQFSADASMDGTNWTPVKIATSPPVGLDTNWFVTVVSADGKLPEDTNFVRLNLEGDGFADSPQVGAIRMTYGATKLTHIVMRTRIPTHAAAPSDMWGVPDAPPWNNPNFHAAVRSAVLLPHVADRGFFWILRYRRGAETLYTTSLIPLTGDQPNPLNATTVAQFHYGLGSGLWSALVYDKDKVSGVTVPSAYVRPAEEETEQVGDDGATDAGSGTPQPGAGDDGSTARHGASDSNAGPSHGGTGAPPTASSDAGSGAAQHAASDNGSGTPQPAPSDAGSGASQHAASDNGSGTPQPAPSDTSSGASQQTASDTNSGTSQQTASNNGDTPQPTPSDTGSSTPPQHAASNSASGTSQTTSSDGTSQSQQQVPTDGTP